MHDYPGSTYTFTVIEQYRNMKLVLDQHPQIVENAIDAGATIAAPESAKSFLDRIRSELGRLKLGWAKRVEFATFAASVEALLP